MTYVEDAANFCDSVDFGARDNWLLISSVGR